MKKGLLTGVIRETVTIDILRRPLATDSAIARLTVFDGDV
jgi:hypothetical protein